MWMDTKNGGVTVKSFCSSLTSRGVDPFPYGIDCKSMALVRVKFSTWKYSGQNFNSVLTQKRN